MSIKFLSNFVVLPVAFALLNSPSYAGASECGLTGTLQERVAQCGRSKCIAISSGAFQEVQCSASHQFEWNLVTETPFKHEVWLDSASQLMWSDQGHNGSQIELKQYCESATGDGSNPDTAFDDDIKGRLTAVNFRLPSLDELKAGIADGIGVVVPSFRGVLLWTETLFGETDAWSYSQGKFSHRPRTSTDEYFQARCVATY